MTKSRLPHQGNQPFVIVYKWIAVALGRDAAMVAGHLDYLDRQYEIAGNILISRSGLIAALEHLIGRDAVMKGLDALISAGLVEQHEQFKPGSPKPRRVYRMGPATYGWVSLDNDDSQHEQKSGSDGSSQGGSSSEVQGENPAIAIYKSDLDSEQQQQDGDPGRGPMKDSNRKNAADADIEVSDYLSSISGDDQELLEQLTKKLEKASPEQKMLFVNSCRKQLVKATDKGRYLRWMASSAARGELKGPTTEISNSSTPKILPEDEINKILDGKMCIKTQEGKLVAEISIGGLYLNNRRFSVVDTSNFLLRVMRGELQIE